MEFNNITQLLNKYWEGETSLQEEEKLKQYFTKEKVAQEHLEFQPLFQFFKEEQDVMISDDFEKRLLKQIENEPQANVRKLKWVQSIRTIAAIGIILLGSVFIFNQINKSKTVDPVADRFSEYEITDEKEAYEATKAALLLLSGKMKKGTSKASKGLTEIKSAKNRTFK